MKAYVAFNPFCRLNEALAARINKTFTVLPTIDLLMSTQGQTP